MTKVCLLYCGEDWSSSPCEAPWGSTNVKKKNVRLTFVEPQGAHMVSGITNPIRHSKRTDQTVRFCSSDQY